MYRRPYHVLVVDDHPMHRHWVASVLRRRDYAVSDSGTADQARRTVFQYPLDLLIASARIGGLSGLQFILACRSTQSDLAGILIAEDPKAIEMDALRHRIVVIGLPVDPDEFLMVVAEQLAAIRRRQRWPRKRLRRDVPVRLAGQPGRLVDVSYGGLRAALPVENGALPARMVVAMPQSELHVAAELVWSARGEDGTSCECGVAVTDDPDATPAWRQFVDQVS